MFYASRCGIKHGLCVTPKEIGERWSATTIWDVYQICTRQHLEEFEVNMLNATVAA